MRNLITGAGGFAGRHLVAQLRAAGEDVHAAGHNTEISLDFRVAEHVDELLAQLRPQRVYHLAGTSSVAEVARASDLGTDNILRPAANLIASMQRQVPTARLLLVSTCHVYGRPEELPITEDHPLRPVDLYGSARASVEYLVRDVIRRGLDVVIARAFHHTGPGQDRRFALANWAAQAAEGSRQIAVGDLSLRRDYCDVRDVVAGYHLLAAQGQRGEVYNLCSGEAPTLAALFAELVGPDVQAWRDDGRLRRGEVLELRGDPGRAEALGWQRRFSIAQTLADLRSSFRKGD